MLSGGCEFRMDIGCLCCCWDSFVIVLLSISGIDCTLSVEVLNHWCQFSLCVCCVLIGFLFMKKVTSTLGSVCGNTLGSVWWPHWTSLVAAGSDDVLVISW